MGSRTTFYSFIYFWNHFYLLIKIVKNLWIWYFLFILNLIYFKVLIFVYHIDIGLEYKVKTRSCSVDLSNFVFCSLFLFDILRTVISIALFAIGNSSSWLSFVKCVLVLKHIRLIGYYYFVKFAVRRSIDRGDLYLFFFSESFRFLVLWREMVNDQDAYIFESYSGWSIIYLSCIFYWIFFVCKLKIYSLEINMFS